MLVISFHFMKFVENTRDHSFSWKEEESHVYRRREQGPKIKLLNLCLLRLQIQHFFSPSVQVHHLHSYHSCGKMSINKLVFFSIQAFHLIMFSLGIIQWKDQFFNPLPPIFPFLFFWKRKKKKLKQMVCQNLSESKYSGEIFACACFVGNSN